MLPGYHEPLRRDRPDGYGGVALYVKDSILLKQRKDLENDNVEAVWADVQTKNFKCTISSMYRPPNSNCEKWKHIEDSIETARGNHNTNIFIMGDLNCDQLTENNRLTEYYEDKACTN